MVELSQIRKQVRQCGRRAYAHRKDHTDEMHEEYKRARNGYASMIQKAKWEHWEEFFEKLDQNTVWTAHRYAAAGPMDGGRARIPKFKAKREDGTTWIANTNEEKEKMLFETFFPSRGEGMQGIPDDTHYPTPAFKFKPVTNEQIKRAIIKLSSSKAPGPNSIPNIILKQCIDVLLPYIE